VVLRPQNLNLDGNKISQFGGNRTYVVMDDNKILCWGDNKNGRLGLGHEETVYIPTVFTFFGDNKVRLFMNGRHHTFAITEFDDVYGWGENESFQVGVTNKSRDIQVPTIIPNLCNSNIVEILCGLFHTVAFARIKF